MSKKNDRTIRIKAEDLDSIKKIQNKLERDLGTAISRTQVLSMLISKERGKKKSKPREEVFSI